MYHHVNIKIFYVMPTECINNLYGSHKSNYFHIRHLPTGLFMCSLRSTKKNLEWRQPLSIHPPVWILVPDTKPFFFRLYMNYGIGKLKCTLVQALRFCTGRTAHRGSRGIALLFLDHGTRRGWGVSVTPRLLLTPGKTRYPLYRKLGGPQGRSGQVRENLAPTGIRSPDRPARSQSLHRLRYPAHMV